MSTILVLDTNILAVDPQDAGDTWATPDQIIPKRNVEGAQVIDVALPDDYAPGRYRYAGGFIRIPAIPPAESEYVAAVQAHLDAAAKAKGYDDIVSACSYAGATNPFQAEGQAFLAWRGAVWAHCYTLLAQVQAGTTQPPTIADLIAGLPALALP